MAALLSLASLAALGQAGAGFALDGARLKRAANGVLALMQYSLTPDVTTSSLSIDSGTSGNPGYSVTQFGGGFTISKRVPLYLEGIAAYSRFDPTCIASDGTEQREAPLRWNSANATGGIGWDSNIARDLVLRPIVSFSLWRVASDVAVLARLIEWKSEQGLAFIDGGELKTRGPGGSLMLDYELVRPDYEIDLEARYNDIQLRSFGSAELVEGNCNARNLNVWARWRAPPGLVVMERPLRYVLESTFSNYFTSIDALGFERLLSLGVGLEFDSSKYDIIVTRSRLMAHAVRGGNVEGYSFGFAVSF